MTRIRDSRRGEAPALEALQRRATDVWERHREALAAHPDALAVPRDWIDEGRVRVAVDEEGGVVGFAVTLADELDSLYVEPGVMGGGVGRLLVEDAATRARAAGARELHVTANENARGFYAQVGFVATADVPTRFGPGVRMRLDLGALTP